MKKHIRIMKEPHQYEDYIAYEFDNFQDAHNFVKNMRGVLVCVQAYITEERKDGKYYIMNQFQ